MRRGLVGATLLTVGLLMVVGTIIHSELMGLLVLSALGLLFLFWGILARQVGPLIPAGILTGLGGGALMAQLMTGEMPGAACDGLIVLGLALGFLAIVPLTKWLASCAQYWPFIPGGILLAIGICLVIVAEALRPLDVFGTYLWPVALIAGGSYLLCRAYTSK
jgi:hypothetical protein